MFTPKPNINLSLIAHINNDAFIAGSHLEGREYSETITLFNNFLLSHGNGLLTEDFFKKNTEAFRLMKSRLASMLEGEAEYKKILEKLQRLNWDKLTSENVGEKQEFKVQLRMLLLEEATPLANRILALKPNDVKSVLMPGGWSSKLSGKGHAIAYEFKRDAQGNVLFYLYNSGAGLEFHEEIPSTDKRRYKTVKCFKIPAPSLEDLKYFIAELDKPRVLPFFKSDITYDAEVLYREVFPKVAWLKGQEIPLDTENNISSGQRSGTCAEKSLHELIKGDVGDRKAKLIIFCLKVYSIELFLNSKASSGAIDAAELSQLIFATQNLARRMEKQKDELPAHVRARAEDIITHVSMLHKNQEARLKHAHNQSLDGLAHLVVPPAFNLPHAERVVSPSASEDTIVERPNVVLTEHERDALDAFLPKEGFSIESLKKFCRYLKKSYSAEPPDYLYAEKIIFYYLTHLPLQRTYFESVFSAGEALNFMDAMQELLTLYGQACEHNGHETLSPTKLVALLSAMEAIDIVYKKPGVGIGTDGITAFNIPSRFHLGGFNEMKQKLLYNPYLCTQSPDLDKRIKSIVDNTSSLPPGAKRASIDLDYIKAYLERPGKEALNTYLQEIYEKLKDKHPFSKRHNDIINYRHYQALFAYLHFLELSPAGSTLYKDEVFTVKLFKKTLKIVEDMQKSMVSNFSVGGPISFEMYENTWMRQEGALKLEQNYLITSDCRVDTRKLQDSFKKIDDHAMNTILADMGTKQLKLSAGPDNLYADNKIFGGKNHVNDPLYQQLQHLRSAPGLQFLTSVLFFKNNMELLSSKGALDNARKLNMQEYLIRTLFQPGIILQAIENNPNCLSIFSNFIDKAILSCTDHTKAPITDDALYFYQLRADVNSYVLKIKNEDKELMELYDDLKNATKKSQEETFRELSAINLKKLPPMQGYAVAKIKLRSYLDMVIYDQSEDKEKSKKLFDLFMEFKHFHTGIQTTKEEKEEKEIHAKLTELCLERLYRDASSIFDWAIQFGVHDKSVLDKITRQAFNYPYFYGYDAHGNKIVSVDLTNGRVFVGSSYQCAPPDNLFNSTLFQEIYQMALDKEKYSQLLARACCNENNQYKPLLQYEVLGSVPPETFFETGDPEHPWVYQQQKTVLGSSAFYEKQILKANPERAGFTLSVNPNNIKAHTVSLTLPECFYGKDTEVWVCCDKDAQHILIEQKNKQYVFNTHVGEIQELDERGQPTGFILNQDNAVLGSITDIFAKFEDKEFMTLLYKKDKKQITEFKVSFPRYNLNLKGEFNKKENKWIVFQEDNPHLVLVDDAHILTKPSIKNGLVFEDKETKKQVIYMPNQSYYIDKDAAIQQYEKEKKEANETVYYYPILDRTNVHKRRELGIGVRELKITPDSQNTLINFPKGLITYSNSETYFTYTVDPKTKEAKADSAEATLYLAYLHLINIDPESAFQCVKSLIKTGLKGSVSELEIIEKIMQGAPELAEKPISSPAFIAVRTHLLYLCSKINNNFDIPDSKNFPSITPDEVLHKKHCEKLETFKESLGKLTIEYLEKNYNTRNNAPLMQLSLAHEYEIMSLNNVKKKGSYPLRMRYQELKKAYLTKEKSNILDMRQGRPDQSRLKIIEEKLMKPRVETFTGKPIGPIVQKFTLQKTCTAVNPNNIVNFDALLNPSKADSVPNNLLDIEEDFVSQFIEMFEVAKNPEHQHHNALKDFLDRTLEAHCFVSSEKQRSIIPVWSATLRTVMNYPEEFSELYLSKYEHECYLKFANRIFDTAWSINETINIPTFGSQDETRSIDVELKAANETEMGFYHAVPITVSDSVDDVYKKENVEYEQFIKNAQLDNFDEEVQKLERETQKKVQVLKDELTKMISNKKFEETTGLRQEYDEKIGAVLNDHNNGILNITKKYFTNTQNIEDVMKISEDLIKDLKSTITLQERELLKFANKILWEQHSFALSAQKVRELTMSDLNRLFVLADQNEYKKATRLDDISIQQLHDKMAQFVNFGILQTQHEKIKKRASDLASKNLNDKTNEVSIIEFGKALSAKNIIPTKGNVADLQFFQKEEEKLIWKSQKDYLEILLEKKESGDFGNEIIQLIMGGGKSKIISPLSALKKANGTNLVIFEVKSSLLKVNHADMAAISERLFNQQAILFEFDRLPKATSEDLKKLYHKFLHASVDKNYIVTSGTSLQSLELQYLETLSTPPDALHDSAEEEKEWVKKIKWFEKTLLLLKYKGDRIIDEVHDELDPIKELNYTMGPPSDALKADVNLSINLFFYLKEIDISTILHPAIKKTAYDLISDPSLIVDPMKVMEEIANGLADANREANPIAEILKKLGLSERSKTTVFSKMSKSLLRGGKEDIVKTQLKDYLLNRNDNIKPLLEKLTARERDDLAFIKIELSTILPHTLFKKYKEHYGPSKAPDIAPLKEKLAIPYQALNTPNEKSRFGQFIESLNYTIQMNIQESLSDELILKVISHYLERAKIELSDRDNLKFEDTLACIHFNEHFGFGVTLQQIKNFNEGELSNVMKHFKNSEAFKKSLLRDFILPQVQINAKVLSSNSQNLGSMTHTTQGMTGTPFNYRTFHQAIHFNELKSIGTDGETIDLLKRIEKATEVIACEHYSSVLDLLREAKRQNADNFKKVRAIIDVGALLKAEQSNIKIVKKIVKFYRDEAQDILPPIKFVLYFDNKDDRLYAWDIKNKKSILLNSTEEKDIFEVLKCKPEERFTLYDQARITGTDLTQALDARALVTCNEKTTQSAFLQGVKRMRQFNNNQTVTVIKPKYMEKSLVMLKVVDSTERKITQEEAFEAKSEINNLLTLFNRNQTEQCLQLHLKAAEQKYKNVIRDNLMDIIYNTPDATEKSRLLQLFDLDSIFSRSYLPEYFKNYGSVEKPMPSVDYFQALEKSYNTQWMQLLEKSKVSVSTQKIQDIRDTFKKLTATAVESCPSMIIRKADVLGTQVENQVENQMQNQLQTNLQLEHRNISYEGGLLENTEDPVFRLIEENKKISLNAAAHAAALVSANVAVFGREHNTSFSFDKNLFISKLQTWTLKNGGENGGRMASYHNDYVKPILVAMMVQEKNNPKSLQCIILSQVEAEYYAQMSRETLKHQYNHHHVWFVHPDGTPLHMGSMPTHLPQQYEKVLEQIRFINGDARFIAKQKEGVTWLGEDAEKKMDFLKNAILPFFPKKSEDYNLLRARLEADEVVKNTVEHKETQDAQGVPSVVMHFTSIFKKGKLKGGGGNKDKPKI